MDNLLYTIKRFIPKALLNKLRPTYHFLLAYYGSVRYGHPSRKLTVIGVTGTKGKSTVTELTTAILEAQGYTVGSLSTIQFKYGDVIEKNLFKMTLPGRCFVQKFMRRALDAGCTHVVLELTSEGSKQFRHRFIELDALIFTNLSPEHIESHGSFEKYKQAKLDIAEQLTRSKKRPRYIVANTDNEHGGDFLATPVEHQLPYSLKDLKLHTLHRDGSSIIIVDGTEEVTLRIPLVGLFNIYNTLAAITITRALGVPFKTIDRALRTLAPVRGRVEHISSLADFAKPFTTIVDYAHTPDSLLQFYEAFKKYPKVCILGNTGGGRDTWKRPEMASIAERYCDHIILTNEDPYDEDPRKIVDEMAAGIEDKTKLSIIMDRREAIAHSFTLAEANGYVLISGKGTDPYIMGPNNTKEPWSDADVVREELVKL